MATTAIGIALRDHRDELLTEWTRLLMDAHSGHQSQMSPVETESYASGFLEQLAIGTASDSTDWKEESWSSSRSFIEAYTKALVSKGSGAADTARFVLSLKGPLFRVLQRRFADDATGLVNAVQESTSVLDGLSLYALTAYQTLREDVIQRQQQDMLELSTPVVKLWDGVLALPLIGTLDSARTQVVMESLLQKVVDSGAEIAILDITGVPTVDTLVAQHLLKAVTALRMMGAECIISGIRPQIAQTIVHLGVDLSGVTTKATLADALATALRRTGVTFVKGA